MEYNVSNIKLSSQDIQPYISSCVNKVFAVLGVYETAQKLNDFSPYLVYLKRVCTEFEGLYKILNISDFLSILGLLKGMENISEMDHRTVKSLTFHCISVLKRAKV